MSTTPLLSGPPLQRPLRWRVVLVAGAIALLVAWFWRGDDAESVVEARSTRSAAAATPGNTVTEAVFTTRVPNKLTLDLFASHSWFQQVMLESPSPPAAMLPVAPTAPPLPYSFLGSYERAGEKTVYFLVSGERVYDLHVGDTIDNTYKIDGVTNNQLQITYLPLNISQGLFLGSSP